MKGILAILGVSTAVLAATLPTVDLGYAIQQATINETGQYYNFSNIRYGAAPIGNLRFAAPVSPTGRNTTINDGQTSVICANANPAWELTAAQYLEGVSVATLLNESASAGALSLSDLPTPDPSTSEDCLFLDVMVPTAILSNQAYKRKRSKGAPVLVWIYGGGFTSGSKTASGNPAGLISKSQQNGQDGIIYVALNYRLGIFGWLSGPTFQGNGTANAGLYDQRLALQWVQDNIHLFGGDPDRVTVIGESAGASSIMHQITAFGGLNESTLFQQAIIQSPAFFPVVSNAEQENVLDTAFLWASYLTNSTVSTVGQLRNLPFSILETVNAITVGLAEYGQFTYGPVVDGLITPALPGVLLAHGQFDKDLNIMVGHNSEEGVLFASPFIQNDTAYIEEIRTIFSLATNDTIEYITADLYPPVFDGTQPYTTQFERTALTISDFAFACNTRYLDLAFGNQTYSYLFAVPPGLHAEDVPYTFFNGDTTTSDDGLPVDAELAAIFQSYITNFAILGTPNGIGVPSFPLYGSNSTILEIASEKLIFTRADDLSSERCAWWQQALYY